MKKFILVFTIALNVTLAFSTPLAAQGLSASVTSHLLSDPSLAELGLHARQLGLTESVVASDGKAIDEATCSEFQNLSANVLWDKKFEQIKDVEVYSMTCRTKFLIVFGFRNEAWKYYGTISLSARYTTIPTYTVLPLSEDGRPAILVRNSPVSYGTGLSQDNMQIFAFIDESLRLVFSEPERIELGVPFKHQCCPYEYTEKLTSTFHIIAPMREKPYMSIEETEHTVVNGKSITRYRSYSWNVHWQLFEADASGPFH